MTRRNQTQSGLLVSVPVMYVTPIVPGAESKLEWLEAG